MTEPISQHPIPAGYPVMQVPTALDYTSKDYSSFLASMLTYAAIIFPQWNTSSEGDFGKALLECVAYGFDILSYYGDRITQEAYLPTATQRLSLLNIAATLGYLATNGAPSSGYVTFVTENPWPATTVPAGTQVASTASAVVSPLLGGGSQTPIFETQADVIVPANAGTVQVEVLQGETEVFTAIGMSDGTSGQSFSIPQLGVDTTTISIFVQTSTPSQNLGEVDYAEWNGVSWLVDASPSATAYSVSTDENDVTWINFGDNLNGLVPALNMTIWACYRVIIGAAGNLAAGQVSTIVTPISGVSIGFLGDGVTPNSTAMTGGADPESNDSIRANAPVAFQVQNRAVSADDFASLALNVPGVLMSTAVGNHSTSISLYVLGPDYGPAGPGLVESILDYFDPLQLAGVSLSVVAPDVVLVDVGSSGNNMQLVVADNYAQASVVNNVTSALQAFISPPNVHFGQLLNVSDLYEQVTAVAGVLYCIIPVFTREDNVQTGTASIQFRPTEIPSWGSLFMTTTGGIS
jgi:uncharacterized phage protein gp47/JayE